MPAPTFAIRLPSSVRHTPNSFSLSPLYYHGLDTDTEQSPPYRFEVIQEEDADCRWHLPLWLLFFGVTVSILTLLFLLTGTICPIPGWWSRYDSPSLDMLRIAGDIYRVGHPPSAINDSTPNHPAPVGYVEPRRVFARLTRNGDITAPSTTMRRPSASGPASLVDNTLSLLVEVRIPDTPRDARCTITSGITLARPLETAGKVARVHLWSLEEPISDMNASGEDDHGRRREAQVSSFEVRPGEMPAQRSAEFACPPPQSLHTFEVSCADGDDACSVEVWQGSFRVEISA